MRVDFLRPLTFIDHHVEARTARARTWRVLSASCVALALLTGEAGVWSLALLGAYALACEAAPLRQRLQSLVPALLVAALWVAYYLASGPHGAPGSEFYREPSKPLRAIASGMLDLPIWTASILDGSNTPFEPYAQRAQPNESLRRPARVAYVAGSARFRIFSPADGPRKPP